MVEAVADDLARILKQAGATWDIDVTSLLDVRDDPETAHEVLEQLLGAAVDAVDRMEDQESKSA